MVERQLDLLKGPRQRGTVAAIGPSEFQIHCMVADYLRRGLAPGWTWFHPANGELRNKATAGRLQRMGVRPGVSDILLISAPRATIHALELKAKGGKLSDEQVAWLKRISELGGKAEWADNVDWAMLILKRWGAIRTGFDVERMTK